MLIDTGSVENGKNGMMPAVSATSVSTCAHWPISTPSAQLRLRVTASTAVAKTTPKSSECVNPTPGQPRWNCAGLSEAYTRPFVKRSGIDAPSMMARNEALSPTCFWMK